MGVIGVFDSADALATFDERTGSGCFFALSFMTFMGQYTDVLLETSKAEREKLGRSSNNEKLDLT